MSRLRRLNGPLSAALDNSTIGEWGRKSGVYTWLTTPVETTDVMIDLSATHTVGPLIRLYEWAKPRSTRSWVTSKASDGLDDTRSDVLQRPVRAFSIVFLAALATNTLLLAARGSLDPESLPLRAVVSLIALLGTRV
jgi:hypothetical protein